MLSSKRFFALLIVTITGLICLAGSLPAEAASYSIVGTGGVGLRQRTGPGTSFSIVGVASEGSSINIVCQTHGESVHGSAIWDKLSDGSYVSDYYTSTPVYANFSPGLPVCGSTPAAEQVSGREQRAVEWARSQIGSTAWLGWCDRFVANAYGRNHSGYASAATHLAVLAARGALHYGDYSPPAGALVFFYAGRGNNGAGHVMLSIGGGQAISSEHWVGSHRYGVGVVSTHAGNFGSYAGRAWANSEWPGR